MKNLLLIFLFGSSVIFAQEVCENSEETSLITLNTINKCTIDDKSDNKNTIKHSRELTIRTSSNTKRYLKRREVLKDLNNSLDDNKKK